MDMVFAFLDGDPAGVGLSVVFWLALLGALCLLPLLRALERHRRCGRRRRWSRLPPMRRGSFRRSAVVYILESERVPGLFKVGFSRRGGQARSAEILRDTGHPTRLRHEVRMPWACEVEERLHARLEAVGWRLPRSHGLGTEWYRPPGGMPQILHFVRSVATEVEEEARRLGSWGDRQRILETGT